MNVPRIRTVLLTSLTAGLLCFLALPVAADTPDTLKLTLRTRVETFKGSGAWDEAAVVREFKPGETAIILCDVWDKHWCDSATKRCGVLAEKMETLLKELRPKGVLVIHAPSDCMDFYKDTPQRKRAREAAK